MGYPTALLEVPPETFGIAGNRYGTIINRYGRSIRQATDDGSHLRKGPHIGTPTHSDPGLRTESWHVPIGWTAMRTDLVPGSGGGQAISPLDVGNIRDADRILALRRQRPPIWQSHAPKADQAKWPVSTRRRPTTKCRPDSCLSSPQT